MPKPMTTPPSLAAFTAMVRDAFSFLGGFGFREIAVPAQRAGNPFEIWFGAGNRFVVIVGEGHGTMASAWLEHDGRELPVIYLVPRDMRPSRKAGRKHPRTQLEQIRDAAEWLHRHGADFLGGDLLRFNATATPLPPYKKRIE